MEQWSYYVTLLFERSEFLIDTSQTKSACVCPLVLVLVLDTGLILVLVWDTRLILVLVRGTYNVQPTYVPGISRQKSHHVRSIAWYETLQIWQVRSVAVRAVGKQEQSAPPACTRTDWRSCNVAVMSDTCTRTDWRSCNVVVTSDSTRSQKAKNRQVWTFLSSFSWTTARSTNK